MGAVVPTWSMRALTSQDTEWLVALKEAAMRPDLERLGVWDSRRSRRRLLEELVPASTWLVLVADHPVGSVALRPEQDEDWLQHFYVLPELQGRGLGGAVRRDLLVRRDRGDAARPVRLLAVRGSAALRLYARHGFSRDRDHENGIDVVLSRPPTSCPTTIGTRPSAPTLQLSD